MVINLKFLRSAHEISEAYNKQRHHSITPQNADPRPQNITRSILWLFVARIRDAYRIMTLS